MKNTGDSTKSKGTDNYARNKASKNCPKIAELEGRVGGDNKYPETKGTKNYARNKTSKNCQKNAKLERRVGGDNKYPIQVGGDNKYPSRGHK
jgi:hypothetical protein